MLSKFFLDRPVFAWVIAIIIMLVGGLAIYNLPVSQYPPIAPPSIYIQAFYPGASAETVENSVTQIIEQKMTGLDKMIYLSATSDSAGGARLELTFAPGTDPDLAWSKVQNKLQLAMASLPEVVQRQGVTVGKATRNYLIIVGLISEDGSMDGNDLQGLCPVQPGEGAGPGARRGRGGELRLPVCHAHLAEPRQADRLPPDDRGRSRGAQVLQRGGLGRPVRRGAGGERAAPERLHHRAEHAEDPRGVRRHSRPHQSGRLHRPDQGCGTGGAGNRRLRYRGLLQRQTLRRHGHPAGGGRERPGYGRCGQGQDDGDEPLLPSGDEGRLSLRHHPLRQGGHRGGGQDPLRGHPAGVPGHVAVHGEHPGHPDPDHRGAGGAPGDLRRAGVLRLLHQHADHVRHGALHRSSGGRCHRGGGERGTDHERGRAFAEGGHAGSPWSRSPAP